MIKLFSESSNDNTLMVTEQCDNHCLMCCQPPKRTNDFDYFEKLNQKIINASPLNIDCIGISGGEPTLLGERLINLFKLIRSKYPETLIHILTNGRSLTTSFISELAVFDLSNICFAVPLHSDYSADHDSITCVPGSYNETMKGLYNLAEAQARVELRIIVNALNYKRLPKIADFISYNLPFVENVVFIGMEAIGLAVTNKDRIWIDPTEYQKELEEAVLLLDRWGFFTRISNVPLCLLPPSLHPFSWHSISDWKLDYPSLCLECDMRSSCGGVFKTSKWQSPFLHPIKLHERNT